MDITLLMKRNVVIPPISVEIIDLSEKTDGSSYVSFAWLR